MKVIREKPCQRRHLRVTAPLYVTTPMGERIRAADWSLGGLRIDGSAKPLPTVDEELAFTVELPFQGFDINFEIKARVVRVVAETQTFAVEYTELSERAGNLMRHFIEDLVRGKMATVEDAICRIDVPVTPIATEPEKNKKQEVPVRRWPLRTIIGTAFYLAVGLLVFGYAGLIVHSNIYRLEVKTAVVSKQIETIKVQSDGILSTVYRPPGTPFRRGEKIARIIDPKLEARIDTARITLTAAKDQLRSAERRRQLEERRLKDYQLINQTEYETARADVAGKEQAFEVAEANYNRIAELVKQGFSNARTLDDHRALKALARARLEAARELLKRCETLKNVSARRHHNGREFVVDLNMLDIDIDDARAVVEQRAAELAALLVKQKRMLVHAPFDGMIRELVRPVGAQLLRGETMLVFEQQQEPQIEAFLDQEEILQVGLDSEATVYLPALKSWVRARVSAIDRTSSFVDEQASKYTWRGPEDRSGRVVLDIVDARAASTLNPGLPAVVVFERQTTNSAFAGLVDKVRALAWHEVADVHDQL